MSEWIKCSERLPLEADSSVTFEQVSVLVSSGSGDVYQMDFARGGGHIGMPWAAWSAYGPLHASEIAHWTPLPEPPV